MLKSDLADGALAAVEAGSGRESKSKRKIPGLGGDDDSDDGDDLGGNSGGANINDNYVSNYMSLVPEFSQEIDLMAPPPPNVNPSELLKRGVIFAPGDPSCCHGYTVTGPLIFGLIGLLLSAAAVVFITVPAVGAGFGSALIFFGLSACFCGGARLAGQVPTTSMTLIFDKASDSIYVVSLRFYSRLFGAEHVRVYEQIPLERMLGAQTKYRVQMGPSDGGAAKVESVTYKVYYQMDSGRTIARHPMPKNAAVTTAERFNSALSEWRLGRGFTARPELPQFDFNANDPAFMSYAEGADAPTPSKTPRTLTATFVTAADQGAMNVKRKA